MELQKVPKNDEYVSQRYGNADPDMYHNITDPDWLYIKKIWPTGCKY
jgi:hypothetical protein